ncbi:apolipoprotein N-acyltransferase [Chlamydia gallinacea]|uniref:apolipoprotein N-acyltransferase n=1 Tax=Chlamydia gallinacea TaxID=1457153 RepID=UPI0009900F85|nr:apolipoprotein N-acyltransferase [Chlamydia gallinacea]AQT77626.1 apolipoprotein N-acyltransferase [Chlamydia gallinacea]
MFRIISFFCSWILIAFAQPDCSILFSCLGSAWGYGLLWYSLEPCTQHSLSWKKVFLIVFFWGITLYGWHFSWMLSDFYVGKFIYLVWAMLCGLLACLLSLFSCCLIYAIRKKMFAILWCFPGFWVGIEMLRFYFLLSGMSLDYLGWPITATAYGRQFGGIFGWAGESFLLVMTGISFYLVLLRKRYSFRLWLICALFPYVVGGLHYEYLKVGFSNRDSLRLAVIQPASSPYTNCTPGGAFCTWQRLIHLASIVKKPVDLVIFPEAVLPFAQDRKVYSYDESRSILAPLVDLKQRDEFLTNIDWMRALVDYFDCPVLMGLERFEERDSQVYVYNSATCLSHEGGVFSYDKRILVPGGEYIPCGRLGWFFCKKYFPEYALTCRRLPGIRSGVLKIQNLPKMGISICYEETFGNLLRQYKNEGARFLVNLTNDGWYPSSRLPQVHFFHGILRNQELGMPCVRSCHTGVTVAADALGRVLHMLPYETCSRKAFPGVLQIDLPLQNYFTLYSWWGDLPMIILSIISLSWMGCYFGYRLLAKKEKG